MIYSSIVINIVALVITTLAIDITIVDINIIYETNRLNLSPIITTEQPTPNAARMITTIAIPMIL